MSKDWLLPAVIDPPDTVCVTIEIPKDDTHIGAFWGALQELAYSYNWEWDGLKSGLAVARVWERQIDIASELVRTGVNCMLDCDEVEDCLETSTIITIIEGEITINETDIINNTTEITENETNITNIITGGNDSNVYPVLPTEDDPDQLCGAAHKIALEIIVLTEQTVLDVGLLTLSSWLLALLGIGGWLATNLSLLWTYILANEIALTGVDFDVYQDQVAEALYCADLDMPQAIIDLDTGIPALRRDALIKAMQSVTDAQIALWAFIGSLDDTQDCSAYICPDWCQTFDFKAAPHGLVGLPFGGSPSAALWVSGSGWKGVNTGGSDYNLLGEMQFALTEIVEVEIKVEWGTVEVNAGITLYGRPATPPSDVLDTATPVASSTTYILNWSGSGMYVAIPVWARQSIAPNFHLVEMTIRGKGTSPYGADNC